MHSPECSAFASTLSCTFYIGHKENMKSVSHNTYSQLQFINTGTTDITMSITYSGILFSVLQ